MNEKLNRELIYLVRKYSNWSEEGIKAALTTDVYPTAQQWNDFLRILLLSLGVALTTAGLVFFFAYNWHDLHKFVKIGTIVLLLTMLIAVVLWSKANEMTKNIVLMAASMLVGVLFAVFGQVYQTGADSYDFFWAWTMAITLWVVVSNFAPLWSGYMVLLNTTLMLYLEQITNITEPNTIGLLYLSLNVPFLVAVLCVQKRIKVPSWFTNLLGIWVSTILTSILAVNIFDVLPDRWAIFLVSAVLYGWGIWYVWRSRHVFYFATIAMSLIVLGGCVLVKISDGAAMLLLTSIYIIVMVTMAIKTIFHFQKTWHHESID